MPVIVRSLEAADKVRWLELFDQYITFYEATVPADVIEMTWQRLLTQSDGMIGFSAVADSGTMVGLAHCIFHRSTWSPTAYCYLEDLFVDPVQRGGGIGRALIDEVYAEADRRGASRTYWATAETNATARRLYDDTGELTPFVQDRR